MTARRQTNRRLPLSWAGVAAAVIWNLINLHAELIPVPYLDDASLHAQMVRFATAQFQAGHLPLTSWFPYLGLGSPQFLHYQSLPAMIAGAIGLVTGPDVAFRWTLYLLLSLWPVSVYIGARLFGAGPRASAASAVMAPFLVTATGVGYEQKAYVWIGYGVWTQLWAMATLPLAWGASWRTVRDGRGFLAAVLLTALTAAFHFETGYLAIAPLVLWPLVSGHDLRRRCTRAALILAGTLLATCWVTIPLILQGPWAATNELLRHGPLVNGYGAGRVLGWLVTGQLLDDHRLPVVTVFAGLGFVVACRRAVRDDTARALLVALAVSLLLSFGRRSLGVAVDIIPGSHDLFFRRFMMGIELSALLLAGWGADVCLAGIGAAVTRAAGEPRRRMRWASGPAARASGVLATAAATVVILAPAWSQLHGYDRRNAATIALQQRWDRLQGPNIDPLITAAKRAGGGRVYAGLPVGWGANFTVGIVPVVKYLQSRDVDEVGYTLRTASLMTDPEAYFDERVPGDYTLFGIHYLILPAGRRPPVAARLRARRGPYVLWTLRPRGYIHLGTVVGQVAANRQNVALRTAWLLRTKLPRWGNELRVRWDQPARDSVPRHVRPNVPGRVLSEHDALQQGAAGAVVRLRRPGVAILSASFDPGWQVTVDGRSARPVMLAPALVGVGVPAGTHTVAFRYRGFAGYVPLFLVAGLALLGLAVLDVRLRRHGGWAQRLL